MAVWVRLAAACETRAGLHANVSWVMETCSRDPVSFTQAGSGVFDLSCHLGSRISVLLLVGC